MDGHTSVEAGGRPCRGRDDRGRAADLTADRIGTRPPIPPGSERARPPSGLLAADRTTFNPGRYAVGPQPVSATNERAPNPRFELAVHGRMAPDAQRQVSDDGEHRAAQNGQAIDPR